MSFSAELHEREVSTLPGLKPLVFVLFLHACFPCLLLLRRFLLLSFFYPHAFSAGYIKANGQEGNCLRHPPSFFPSFFSFLWLGFLTHIFIGSVLFHRFRAVTAGYMKANDKEREPSIFGWFSPLLYLVTLPVFLQISLLLGFSCSLVSFRLHQGDRLGKGRTLPGHADSRGRARERECAGPRGYRHGP